MHLLESPQQGDSNKYTQRMFSCRISMKRNTRSAGFWVDQIDLIMNFALITNVVTKRAHCIVIKRVHCIKAYRRFTNFNFREL